MLAASAPFVPSLTVSAELDLSVLADCDLSVAFLSLDVPSALPLVVAKSVNGVGAVDELAANGVIAAPSEVPSL